jgi:hypothetical protein
MSGIARILGALDKVRQTGPGKWIARCPVHDDQSPSLSIKENDAGLVLMHCFGCGANGGEVMRALGLFESNLFPAAIDGRKWDAQRRNGFPRFQARELIDLAAQESRVAALGLIKVISGQALTVDEIMELVAAADALSRIAGEINHA